MVFNPFKLSPSFIFLFLISFLFVWSPAAARSDKEQIRQFVIKRLQSQAEALEGQVRNGKTLRNHLLKSDETEFENILLGASEKLRTYGDALRNHWKIRGQLKEIKGDGNGHDVPYETRLDCLFNDVEKIINQQAIKIRGSIKEITDIPLNKIPNRLKSLYKNDLRKPEYESKYQCKPKMGPALSQPDDQTVSLDWDSQCIIHEGKNIAEFKLTEPTVAALLYDDGLHGSQAFCTGTLIAPNIVLTAAHCFCLTAAKQPNGFFYRTARLCRNGVFYRKGTRRYALDPQDHTVFFQHAGNFKIKKVIIHPQFFWGGRLPFADMAILILEKPVEDIQPTPINNIGYLRSGVFATGVGFGFHRPIGPNGTTIKEFDLVEKTGLKLFGPIRTERCSYSARRRGMICWTYRERFRDRSLASTCKGDSGGPLFARHKGKKYLVGVVSAGDQSCRPGSRSYNFEVFAYKNWLSKQIKKHQQLPLHSPRHPILIARQAQQKHKALNAQQKKCLVCLWCQNRDQGDETRNKFDRKIEIKSSLVKRLRVSLNCTSGLDDSTLGLIVKKQSNLTDNNDKQLCEATGRTAALSCQVKVQNKQTWEIGIDVEYGRTCQIVATTFDQ